MVKNRYKEVENAVMAYIQTLPSRVSMIIKRINVNKDGKLFKMQSWTDFTTELKSRQKDYGVIPKCETIQRIFDAFQPILATYVKDVGSAKILLSEIFHDYTVDRDVKLAHDELKEDVLEEMLALEESLKKSASFYQWFHKHRADKALELQLNPGCEDLMLSLWLAEQQACAESELALLHTAAGYFDLMDSVRETYDVLQLPGIIGHRKAHILKLRENMYL